MSKIWKEPYKIRNNFRKLPNLDYQTSKFQLPEFSKSHTIFDISTFQDVKVFKNEFQRFELADSAFHNYV